MPKLDGLPSTFGARSKLNTTSSAVNGVPSWKRTPLRSLNSQVVASIGFHDSASSGTRRCFSSCPTRLSKTWLSIELLGERLWKCGSIEVGSLDTPMRISCAPAPPATSRAAAIAAASTQRRFFMAFPPRTVAAIMAGMDQLATYYAKRASEYERIYDKPERQADLRALEARIRKMVAGRKVLELACGTGYWTDLIAPEAAQV